MFEVANKGIRNVCVPNLLPGLWPVLFGLPSLTDFLLLLTTTLSAVFSGFGGVGRGSGKGGGLGLPPHMISSPRLIQ